MPNPNYLKGVRKERKIVNAARAEGHIAFRSAGSHSPIDVCIVDKRKMHLRLIQCKPDTMSEKEKQKIIDKVEIDNHYIWKVTFEVI